MKISVSFKTLDGKEIDFRALGKFFEKGNDFYIEVNNLQPVSEKIVTFTEEVLHLILRLWSFVSNKKISVQKEHKLIREIISKIELSFVNADGKK